MLVSCYTFSRYVDIFWQLVKQRENSRMRKLERERQQRKKEVKKQNAIVEENDEEDIIENLESKK